MFMHKQYPLVDDFLHSCYSYTCLLGNTLQLHLRRQKLESRTSINSPHYLLLFLIILAACLRDSILCPSTATRTSLAITPAEYAGESVTMVFITMVFPSSSSLISLFKVRPNEISLLSRMISICKVHV